jgi:uncharacterized protein YbjT (DUF2867 family)
MTTSPQSQSPFLPSPSPAVAVLGGTGRTGRRVVDRLRGAGAAVRVGSRSGTPPFEWSDPATWAPVLAGATAAYVAYTPDLAFPGAAETLGALAEEAARQRVRGLVLLSGRGEPGAVRSEEAVRAAGLPTAVLRSSWFAQNFSEHFLLDSVVDGVIALPAADMAEPFLDLDDLADVAAAVLLASSARDDVLELTGPRTLTFVDAAAELSAATGRRIEYAAMSPAEFVAGAVAAGVPEEDAVGLAGLFADVLDGRNAFCTDDVARVLGRPPRDFAVYARAAAATGVWNVAEVAS